MSALDDLQKTVGQEISGQNAGPAASPDALDMLRSELTKEIGTAVTVKPLKQAPPPNWNAGENLGNAALLGGGLPVMAASQALKMQAADKAKGISDVPFAQYYDAAKQYYQGEKARWASQNPGTDVTSTLVGSIPTTAATMGLAGAGIGAGMEAAGAGGLARFMAGNAGESAPGVGGWLARRASQTVGGAVQGTAAAGLESGLSNKPLNEQLLTGAAIGGPLGLVATPLIRGASIMNAPVDKEVAQLAEKANALGVPLRGGQITEKEGIQKLDSALSGFANGKQLQQFTQAVSRTFGEDAPAITKDVMDKAATRIGKQLDTIAAKGTVDVGQDFVKGLGDVEQKALQNLPTGPELELVRKQVGRLLDEATTGQISGEMYQALTRRGSPLANMISNKDPNIRYYGIQLRNVLDDGLERGSPPEVMGELRQARQQWKNMVTVEDLVEKSQPKGIINPQLMQNAVRQSYKDYGYTGAGDLGTLAEAGKFIASPSSQEGMLAAIPSWMKSGATAGELLLAGADPKLAMTAAGGTALAAAAGHGLGRFMASPLYQRTLINRALDRTAPPNYNLLMPTATELYNGGTSPSR